jgi:hypothetical protein
MRIRERSIGTQRGNCQVLLRVGTAQGVIGEAINTMMNPIVDIDITIPTRRNQKETKAATTATTAATGAPEAAPLAVTAADHDTAMVINTIIMINTTMTEKEEIGPITITLTEAKTMKKKGEVEKMMIIQNQENQ